MTDTHYRHPDGKNSVPDSYAQPHPVMSLPTTLLSTVSAAALSAAGTGYVPGDTVTIAGGDYQAPAVVTITHTKAVSAAVVAGGTGGTPGAVTVTGTTGTGTKFQATGTITAGGVLAGALVVTVAGDYTVNPTSIAVEPVTGGSLTGATVVLVMGALTASVTTAGLYYTLPTNPTAQLSTSGVGTGATFTLTSAAYAANSATSPTYVAGALSNGSDAVAATTTNIGVDAFLYGWNGATFDRLNTTTPAQIFVSNSFLNVAAGTATTVVKSGAGTLASVVINTVGIGNTLTIYDNTAASGTKIATINTAAAVAGVPFTFNVAVGTGITCISAGGTGADYTVTYR